MRYVASYSGLDVEGCMQHLSSMTALFATSSSVGMKALVEMQKLVSDHLAQRDSCAGRRLRVGGRRAKATMRVAVIQNSRSGAWSTPHVLMRREYETGNNSCELIMAPIFQVDHAYPLSDTSRIAMSGITIFDTIIDIAIRAAKYFLLLVKKYKLCKCRHAPLIGAIVIQIGSCPP
eukprot:6175699-Pleurochrysis_carterae.AAC.2